MNTVLNSFEPFLSTFTLESIYPSQKRKEKKSDIFLMAYYLSSELILRARARTGNGERGHLHGEADIGLRFGFLCTQVYYVEWHLCRAWAPLLCDDEVDSSWARDASAAAEPSLSA
jgi:hypothetical protein